jgi:hypothetical protein
MNNLIQIQLLPIIFDTILDSYKGFKSYFAINSNIVVAEKVNVIQEVFGYFKKLIFLNIEFS